MIEVCAEVVSGHEEPLFADPRLDGVSFAVERQDVTCLAQDVRAFVRVGQKAVPLGDEVVDAAFDVGRGRMPLLVDQELRCGKREGGCVPNSTLEPKVHER